VNARDEAEMISELLLLYQSVLSKLSDERFSFKEASEKLQLRCCVTFQKRTDQR